MSKWLVVEADFVGIYDVPVIGGVEFNACQCGNTELDSVAYCGIVNRLECLKCECEDCHYDANQFWGCECELCNE